MKRKLTILLCFLILFVLCQKCLCQDDIVSMLYPNAVLVYVKDEEIIHNIESPENSYRNLFAVAQPKYFVAGKVNIVEAFIRYSRKGYFINEKFGFRVNMPYDWELKEVIITKPELLRVQIDKVLSARYNGYLESETGYRWFYTLTKRNYLIDTRVHFPHDIHLSICIYIPNDVDTSKDYSIAYSFSDTGLDIETNSNRIEIPKVHVRNK